MEDRVHILMTSDLVQSKNQFTISEAARLVCLNSADTAGLVRNLMRDGRLIKIESIKKGAKNQLMTTYVLNNGAQKWLRKKW